MTNLRDLEDLIVARGACMAPRVVEVFDHDRRKPEAVHVCRSHCPVRAECGQLGAAVDRFLRRDAVYGGGKYTSDGKRLVGEGALKVAHRCLLCPPIRYVTAEALDRALAAVESGKTVTEMIQEIETGENAA